MMIAADYAHAVAYLDHAHLPAYVSFIEQAEAHGLAGDREAPQRIYVRTSDGVIVSGVPPQNAHVVTRNNDGSDNPFGKRPLFDPKCYTPESENPTRWNGRPAIRFVLHATCKEDDDIGITELYADPQTLRPIAVDGTVKDIEANMTVAIEMDYTTVGTYTVPAIIRAHAVGHGWLFWARERAEVDYTNYEFYSQAEFTRRQAAKPPLE